MTDVMVPGVGTLKFPDGMSQQDMASAIQKNFPQIHGPQAAPSGVNMTPPHYSDIGPAPNDPAATQKMYQQTAQDVAQGDSQIPTIQSESFHNKSIPVLGGMASMLVPGAGWGALALQSLAAGAGTAGGELIRQQQGREPIQPKVAATEGAKAAVGTAVAGAAVKGLGALAKKIFSSPLSEPQQAAAQFAQDQGVPFPLSSAAPETAAGKIQQGSRIGLAGDIKTQLDANKVTTYLNNTVGQMTEKGQVFDDAARQGQQFLRDVFEPGETAIKNTFSKYTEAVGEGTPIPTQNTLAAAQKAADMLENRGQTTGGLYQRLRTILKKDPQTFTTREFDELYGSIIKQAFTSKAGAGGEGKLLLQGITSDLDTFGKTSGVNFADDIAKATSVREQFRELRNIPQLQRLASEMGDRGGTKGTIDWMNSLFSSGNGKALSKLRELNPDLYHDLSDAWLARQIDNAADYSSSGIGRQINGAKLRTWFTQNQDKVKEIFGAPQAQALDNFSLYASHMTGAVERSVSGKTFEPLGLMSRVGAEAASTLYKPGIVVMGEPASFMLARGLADPSSSLFRVFTKGFSPATRTFMVKSGELAGQQAVRGKDTR